MSQFLQHDEARASTRRRRWRLRWKAALRAAGLFGRCAPALFFVGVVAVMMQSPQAQDLLRGMLANRWDRPCLPAWLPIGDGIWIIVWAFVWATLVELCARSLVLSPYPNRPQVGRNAPYALVIRIVGIVAMGSVLFAALSAAEISDPRSELYGVLGQRLVFAILFLFLVLFMFFDGPLWIARLAVRGLPVAIARSRRARRVAAAPRRRDGRVQLRFRDGRPRVPPRRSDDGIGSLVTFFPVRLRLACVHDRAVALVAASQRWSRRQTWSAHTGARNRRRLRLVGHWAVPAIG